MTSFKAISELPYYQSLVHRKHERRGQRSFKEAMPSFPSLSHPGGEVCLRSTAGARGFCLTSRHLLDCLGLSKDAMDV